MADPRTIFRRAGASNATGLVVLGLFAWFALSACLPMAEDPPMPGPDTVYNDVAFHHNPDGSTVYGDFHCNNQGKYVGGGSPQSEARVKGALESAISSVKGEIDAIDRRLDQCKGKGTTPDSAYRQRFSCDQQAADGAKRQMQSLGSEFADARARLARVSEAREQTMNELHTRINALGGVRRSQNDKETIRLKRAMDDYNHMINNYTADMQRTEGPYNDALNQWRRLQLNCDQATQAAKGDPCSDYNFYPLAGRRNKLRERLATYERDLDNFKDCDKNRERQASRMSPDAASTIGPALLMQTLPLLTQPHGHGSSHGHDSRSSGGSSGGHSHSGSSCPPGGCN